MIPNEFPFTWKMIFIRVPPPFITQYLMLHAFPHSIYPYISTDHWLMLLLLLLKHLKKKKTQNTFLQKSTYHSYLNVKWMHVIIIVIFFSIYFHSMMIQPWWWFLFVVVVAVGVTVVVFDYNFNSNCSVIGFWIQKIGEEFRAEYCKCF